MLGRETVGSNLESVLMDQKMRADKHRMNFDTLKSQHIVLQEVGGVEGVGSGWGWEEMEGCVLVFMARACCECQETDVV